MSGTIWVSSNDPRPIPCGSASSGLPDVPNQPTPKPGQISDTVATSAQNVARKPTIQTPTVPPGTRYGRATSGCVYRSRISAGNTPRYEIVVVEMASPSTAAKYFSALPPDSQNASSITIVEKTPVSTFTVTGVPNRREIRPNSRGAEPSKPAAACVRSAPMIQVVPLDSSAQMNVIAARSPSTLPAPVSVTVPSAATLPPYTVNTCLMASRKPPTPVTRDDGRINRIARIGTPYSSTAPSPDQATVRGTSFCGSTISSLAELGSSKPT